MNNQEHCKEHWQQEDRRGGHSSQSVAAVAQEMEACFGIGSLLDVGCGNGHLVRQLNARGWDAQGIDVSDAAVACANGISPGRFQVGNILQLPYSDDSFDFAISTHCLEHLQEGEVAGALAELRRVARRGVYLRMALSEAQDNEGREILQNREWWETRCFEAGFRKHPRYFLGAPFGSLDNQLDLATIVLSKVPEEAQRQFPLEALLEERQLHTDMSREAGRRSDAHNMRYFEAARSVRPGDRVIDMACGLGYGSTILTKNSRCGSYLGIDNSQFAIDYATRSFAEGEDALRFQQGSLPECLQQFPPASFDFIASFETLEHLQENQRFLEECHRILSPGGRLMVSVPNDWTEEDGLDPNPHHFHVYDWGRLLEELEGVGFAIEKTVAETVSRRKEQGTWAHYGYEWQDYPVDQVRGKPGEWCIALAMKSPLATEGAEYINRAFPEVAGAPPTAVMDFASQYQNPWLIPALVTRGLRTERLGLRVGLAQEVLDGGASGPDQGASLCVAAYALLDGELAWSEVETLLGRVDQYVANRDWEMVPSVELRWGTSLRYVAALLSLRGGMRDRAKGYFEACASMPFMRYSPLLATKVVGAAVQRAMLAMADRDVETIEAWLAKGLELAELAVGSDWQDSLGDLHRQPLAAFRELAEVVELAAQCATGLALLRTGSLDMVYFEQFRATKTSEIQRLSSENAQLHAYAKSWQEASQFWQEQAQQAEPQGIERHFARCGRSIAKRVTKLKGMLRREA